MCGIAEATLAMMVVGAGVQIQGQQAQAKIANQQAQYQQAVLANNKIIVQQDIKSETSEERARQRLIADEGSRREGDIRVAQAALGQLVDVGSAADTTEELAGEVAMKKLLSKRSSDARIRNLEIAGNNLEADIGLLGLQRAATSAKATTDAFSTVLSTGSSLGQKFKFDNGELSFRT